MVESCARSRRENNEEGAPEQGGGGVAMGECDGRRWWLALSAAELRERLVRDLHSVI